MTEPAALDDARLAVERTVAAFDLACSSFREDSQLATVNAGAGAPVAAGELLIDAVQEALRAARLTGGDLDPTVGQALIAFGFIPAAGGAPRFRLERPPGWRTVSVDRAAGTIALPRGVRLDLGATAKALAADRAAAAAHAAVSPAGVLVGLSGDLALAGPAPAGGWRVRVTDDHRADLRAPGQWVELRSGGLATSSTTVRSRQVQGQLAHHVIDPATGAPAASGLRTVTVAAASCLDANIASTAMIIRGERAVDWLIGLGLPSRLVRDDGTVAHVAGWPEGAEDLPSAAAIGGPA